MRRSARIAVLSVVAGLALLASLNTGCCAPLRDDVLRVNKAPLTVDADLELARRYAPIAFHAVDETRGRQDIPTRADFDGNLRGDDNWETFLSWELPPTLSYAVLRTETHLFITYHIFHPRDWEPVRLGLHLTHENDGENLQVVVDRATGAVVLLFTQAHYVGGVYAGVMDAAGEGVVVAPAFGDGSEDIRGPMALFDGEGRPDPHGTHAGVFVEERGHGIYGSLDSSAEVVVAPDGTATFDEAGLVFVPAAPGQAVKEPELGAWGEVGVVIPYQLESTTARLWPGLVDGSLVGEGGLIDGALHYSSPVIEVDVPRYYEADRFSGPFGPDRGISPFAVDFDFGEGEVGALFFDPARRYAECLAVPGAWSLEYEGYPFVR